MSDPKLISPMLDDIIMGGPISDHHGVQCCPAMRNETDEKFIVKVISIPATPTQMDALLLTGAYPDEPSALLYFKELADDVIDEVETLKQFSELEGFIPYSNYQLEAQESGKGFDIYLLSPYKRNLEKHFKRHILTHLDALNLGLDLCAALSVCRRNGYLYVNLKPSNVFVTGEHLYRIGDLGFIRLSSLKYASLPEKYFSAYTPPEITDAFSSLNSTMDIYAAGLILYQAYNNGALPFNDQVTPGSTLPAPLYADYEMSEIILKACAANPEERWQDPTEMGQAIISYMQKNGAKDTPIVPATVREVAQPAVAETEPVPTEEVSPKTEAEPESTIIQDNCEEKDVLNLSDIDSNSDESETTEESSEPQYDTAEESDDLSFLSDIDLSEEESDSEPDYESVSDDVTEILSQVEELAALEVPEPVVAPDFIEVKIPEPEISKSEVVPELAEREETTPENEQPATDISAETIAEKSLPKKKHHWVRNSILILLLLALLAGGYYYYKSYYLLPIESIAVDGSEDSLTVSVKTEIDESLLQVVCYDTYGNQILSELQDGKAEFSNLIPDTAYTIKLISSGFHQLVGNIATAYSTPVQSHIVQFDAVTGNSDGSVILSFTVEGPDCQEWNIAYSAEGEEEQIVTFASHMVTLTDLIVAKDYTFRLFPSEDLYISGLDEINYTAKRIVKADGLTITSCTNNTLSVTWTVAEDETVDSWSVRCFNDTYSETIITTDLFADFQIPDDNAAYSVEVKAAGMSVSQMVSIPANSVTASNFQITTEDPTNLGFSWNSSKDVPAEGWFLCYTIDGIEETYRLNCTENAATLFPIIPNAIYRMHLEDAYGNMLLGSDSQIATGDSVPYDWSYDGYDVHTKDLIFLMCRTPDKEGWDRYDLANSDYTTTFTVGEDASFLVKITKIYSTSTEEVNIMYVIRNKDGLPISMTIEKTPWRSMWYKNYCELDIPVMPSVIGEYTMEVYFNGGQVVSQPFTIH